MTIAFHIATWIALAIVAILIFLILFEPGLAYRISAPDEPLDSHEFLGLVTALVDAQLLGHSRVDVLRDGRTFYASELAAIRGARHSVHIESYVFRPGRVSERFLDALSERARAGVAVRLIVDAIGSFPMQHASFAALRAAGGEVFRYCPIRWYTLKRFNNRTHREIIVVDGTIGFAGGAGMADWWAGENEPGQDGGGRPWRDSMIRIEGELVGGLQTTFVENWLEASGELLSGVEHFPFCRADRAAPVAGHVTGLVVSSTPSAGRATRARMLFQLLMASARECIEICSPYFIPDRSMRQELVRAVCRGVIVRIIVPGRYNDHPIVRWASRRLYGELLRNGIEIHEYRPAMTHAKICIVDGVWSLLGSTNFDNRSFGLNDEINVAIVDRDVATRIREDFARDLQRSHRVSLHEWTNRSATERLLGSLSSVFALNSDASPVLRSDYNTIGHTRLVFRGHHVQTHHVVIRLGLSPKDRPHAAARTFASATDQSRSGPGSSSPPPVLADPNFGTVNHPKEVVRGGLGCGASAPSSAESPSVAASSLAILLLSLRFLSSECVMIPWPLMESRTIRGDYFDVRCAVHVACLDVL